MSNNKETQEPLMGQPVELEVVGATEATQAAGEASVRPQREEPAEGPKGRQEAGWQGGRSRGRSRRGARSSPRGSRNGAALGRGRGGARGRGHQAGYRGAGARGRESPLHQLHAPTDHRRRDAADGRDAQERGTDGGRGTLSLRLRHQPLQRAGEARRR